MTAKKPKRPDDSRFCGAKAKRTGKPCKRPAGWGTKHPGVGLCKLHGGCKEPTTPKGILRRAGLDLNLAHYDKQTEDAFNAVMASEEARDELMKGREVWVAVNQLKVATQFCKTHMERLQDKARDDALSEDETKILSDLVDMHDRTVTISAKLAQAAAKWKQMREGLEVAIKLQDLEPIFDRVTGVIMEFVEKDKQTECVRRLGLLFDTGRK